MRGTVVVLQQYRVFVDGVGVGFLGFEPGAKLCLVERFTPIEAAEIERQVQALTKQEKVTSVQAPDVPEELLRQDNDDGINENDFDS